MPGDPVSNTSLQSSDGKRKKDSLSPGFGLGCGFVLILYLVALILFLLHPNAEQMGYLVLFLFFIVPWLHLLPLVLFIVFTFTGKTRTAMGMVLGYACGLALALLFISICTGLEAWSNH